MKAPENEILSFDKNGGYKITKKNFWLVSGKRDAYGKNICEGDYVYVREENFTYNVEFDGNAFVLADRLGAVEGNLADFDSYELEIRGHIAEES